MARATEYYGDNVNFPPIMNAIIQRVLFYLATKLYPDEDPDDLIQPESPTKKFILANFEGGEEIAVRRQIEELQKSSSAIYPFTAYNSSEETLELSTKSHLQVSGKVFNSEVNGYVQAIPATWDFPAITFTSNVQDYFRARQLLSVDASRLTRITVPITINNVLTSFPIDITFELTKGSYAFQFEEYLSKGRIYDLVHNLKIKFLYFILNDVPISPVDNIEMSLKTLATQSNSTIDIQTYYSPVTSIVTSTTPVTNTIGFDKTQSIIINFNNAMNESLTNSYIDIEPMFPCNFIWNDPSTQLTLSPKSGLLDASTNYIITIEKSAQSIYQATLEDDYILNFTTGV